MEISARSGGRDPQDEPGWVVPIANSSPKYLRRTAHRLAGDAGIRQLLTVGADLAKLAGDELRRRENLANLAAADTPLGAERTGSRHRA